MSGEYHHGGDSEFGRLLRDSRDGRGYGELPSFYLVMGRSIRPITGF